MTNLSFIDTFISVLGLLLTLLKSWLIIFSVVSIGTKPIFIEFNLNISANLDEIKADLKKHNILKN